MLNHRFAVEHSFIRNPENPYPRARDRPVTRLVILPLFFVHAAVKFDRKLGSIAIEVDDESFDYLLTAEVKSVDGTSPNGLPENALGRGHFAAQSFGERQLIRLNTLDARYFTAVWHALVVPSQEPNP